MSNSEKYSGILAIIATIGFAGGIFFGRAIFSPKHVYQEIKYGDIIDVGNCEDCGYLMHWCMVASKPVTIDYFKDSNGRCVNGNRYFTADVLDPAVKAECEDGGVNREMIWDKDCKIVGHW